MEVLIFFPLVFAVFLGDLESACASRRRWKHIFEKGEGEQFVFPWIIMCVCSTAAVLKKGSRGQKEEMTKAPLGGTLRLECVFSVFENVHNLTVCGSWGWSKFKPIRNLRFLVTGFSNFCSCQLFSSFKAALQSHSVCVDWWYVVNRW